METVSRQSEQTVETPQIPDESLLALKAQFINWEQASRDTIDFKKVYVDIARDLIAGLVLSQIIYWHLPGKNSVTRLRVEKNGHLWIAKHRREWWNEIRITPKQLDRALEILRELKLVETGRWHFDGRITLHVRLIWETFIPVFQASILPKGENTGGGILTKGENAFSPKGKILTENTNRDLTENTIQDSSAQALSNSIPMSAIPGRWCLGAGETRLMHFVVDDGKPIKSKALCGAHPFTFANPVKMIGPAMEYCPDCLKAGLDVLCPERPPKRRAERKADPVFDAIALGSFNMPKVTNGSGGRIAKLSKGVRECVPEEYRSTLGDDLGKMYAWYKTKYPNLSAPAAAETICKYLAEWRGSQKPCRDDIDKKLGGHYEEREIKPGVFKRVFVKVGGEVIYS